MKKWLWTFGVGTLYKGKCVITTAEDFDTAMGYMYENYGQGNISSSYPDTHFNIGEIISKWGYEVIEEVTL